MQFRFSALRRSSLSLLGLAFLIVPVAGTGAGLASSHGNALVHSREYRGQVYMMNQNHMSLYYYLKDGPGVSNCNGACARAWPPLILDANVQLGENYSLIRRADGTMQAAFKGRPLYLYGGDRNVGDVNGDGVGGVWELARP